MNNIVPEVDQIFQGHETSNQGIRESFELRKLDAESKGLENINRDAEQRLRFRTYAMGTSLALITGFLALLIHVICELLPSQSASSPSLQVAAFVAPIVSITAITITLLAGAFRGFRENDGKNAASGTLSIGKNVSDSLVN